MPTKSAATIDSYFFIYCLCLVINSCSFMIVILVLNTKILCFWYNPFVIFCRGRACQLVNINAIDNRISVSSDFSSFSILKVAPMITSFLMVDNRFYAHRMLLRFMLGSSHKAWCPCPFSSNFLTVALNFNFHLSPYLHLKTSFIHLTSFQEL